MRLGTQASQSRPRPSHDDLAKQALAGGGFAANRGGFAAVRAAVAMSSAARPRRQDARPEQRRNDQEEVVAAAAMAPDVAREMMPQQYEFQPAQQVQEVQEEQWKALMDPNSGRTYYVNRATRETSWQLPAVGAGAALV